MWVAQEPIEIMSSDEETEQVNPPKQPEGQSAQAADLDEPRRSTRSNIWQSTSVKYDVSLFLLAYTLPRYALQT